MSKPPEHPTIVADITDTELAALCDKRVLVTGGAGFIGSHLVSALVEGNDVVVLDDLSTGSKKRVPAEAELIEGDIRDPDVVAEAMEGVDVVFHEAAVVSVAESMTDPEQTHAVNVTGTVRVLEAAKEQDARVVLASSAAVYGHPQSVPIAEDVPVDPTSPYGLSKSIDEQYASLYAAVYDLDVVALRYFNVYGPGQTGGDYSGVITVFFDQARSGGPLTVHGDGEQTRDFVHVRDVVQANLLAAAEGESGRVYNVGTGEAITIRGLAELVRETVGDSEVSIEHVSSRDGDIDQSRADIGRIASELGFEPSVTLADGLAEL